MTTRTYYYQRTMAQEKTGTSHTTPQTSNSDSNDTAIPIKRKYTISEILNNRKEKQDRKLKRRTHRKQTLQLLAQQDNHFLEGSITKAEDKRTARAKANTTEVRQTNINKAHNRCNADKKPAASIKQLARNTTYGICTAIKRAAKRLLTNKKQVTFKLNGEAHNHNKLEHANTVHLT